MSAPLAPVADKLGKLIPRLSSPHGGEVIATVDAIRRTLRGVGADFHDLAAALTISAPIDELPSPREFVPLWQELQPGRKAILIERLLCWDGLSDFERRFCQQMQVCTGRYSRPPSPKQLEVLNQIITKGWREGVCV